jgi:polysaccharide deacetylase 2 family uncharacterized protein YibQ
MALNLPSAPLRARRRRRGVSIPPVTTPAGRVWCGAMAFASLTALFLLLLFGTGPVKDAWGTPEISEQPGRLAGRAEQALPASRGCESQAASDEETSGSHSVTPAECAADEPCLALIIDDWGYAWEAAEAFLHFPQPLTVAVIPYLPYSRRHAEQAHAAGFDVLLHLPMEAENGATGQMRGLITTAMSDTAIQSELEAALSSVPHVVGVNNHTGSRATADRRVMRAVLTVLKSKGLFFVDSRTTAESQVAPVAAELGIPWVANTFFIDGRREVAAIKDRLLLAAEYACAHGYAVAIGHVRADTAQAALTALPEIERLGVRLVRVSELFRYGLLRR